MRWSGITLWKRVNTSIICNPEVIDSNPVLAIHFSAILYSLQCPQSPFPLFLYICNGTVYTVYVIVHMVQVKMSSRWLNLCSIPLYKDTKLVCDHVSSGSCLGELHGASIVPLLSGKKNVNVKFKMSHDANVINNILNVLRTSLWVKNDFKCLSPDLILSLSVYLAVCLSLYLFLKSLWLTVIVVIFWEN